MSHWDNFNRSYNAGRRPFKGYEIMFIDLMPFNTQAILRGFLLFVVFIWHFAMEIFNFYFLLLKRGLAT